MAKTNWLTIKEAAERSGLTSTVIKSYILNRKHFNRPTAARQATQALDGRPPLWKLPEYEVDRIKAMYAAQDFDRTEARALREAMGVSQEQAARELGVSPSTVASWELGRRRPKPEEALRYLELRERWTKTVGAVGEVTG